MGVVRIHIRMFLDYATITQTYHTHTTHVQETPTDRTNVSKIGHKGGSANCLCIFPETICVMRCYSMILFIVTCPTSGQSSSPSGGKTEFSVSHNLSTPSSTAEGTLLSSQPGQESANTGTITNSGKGRRKPTTLGEDALKPITLGINTEALAWHLNW